MILFPHQIEGVDWLQSHFRAILADEPGLGKTLQVLELIRRCPGIRKTLVVCPANVKSVWKNQTQQWALSSQILSSRQETPILGADVTIINYDLLISRSAQLAAIDWDLVVFDEAHYLKNVESQRSGAAFGKLMKANRVLFLTGTPMLSRPVELWPVMFAINRELTGKYKSFTTKYCGGHNGPNGWEAQGATNLEELNELLSKVMIRRYKKDVLPQLPPKIRTVIETDSPLNWESLKEEFGENWKDKIRAFARSKKNPPQEVMARMRQRDGIMKAPFAAAYARSRLEQSPDSKIIIMCHHTKVVDILKSEFGEAAVCLTGVSSPKQKADAADRFQNDESIRVFVGNIQAAGVGITLTRADRVIFAEQSWVPGEMDQAECRPHRIGQRGTVWSDWIVAPESIDSIICPALLWKMEIIDRAINGRNGSESSGGIISEALKLFA